MPRRVFTTTNELLLERMFGENGRRMVLLEVQINHLFGGVKIIVDDPQAAPVPEGNIPLDEPVAR